jgi:hypothetical protein
MGLDPKNLLPGYEQYEDFFYAVTNQMKVQYDYRHPTNKKLFSCLANTLEEARRRRHQWELDLEALNND